MADFSFKQSRKTPKGIKPCPIRRNNKAKQPLLFGPQRMGGERRLEFGNWMPTEKLDGRDRMRIERAKMAAALEKAGVLPSKEKQ